MRLLKTFVAIAMWLAFVFIVFFCNDYIPEVKPKVWWAVPYVITLVTVLISSFVVMAAAIININEP